MIIGGWGEKSKKIADAGILKCRNCKHNTAFEVHDLTKNASLFFVPVAKWGKKTYLVCTICTAGFEISETDKNKLLQDIASLPSNEISMQLWNKIDRIFVGFAKNAHAKGKNLSDPSFFEDWLNFGQEEMNKEGFKNDDIKYVLGIFTKNLLDSVK